MLSALNINSALNTPQSLVDIVLFIDDRVLLPRPPNKGRKTIMFCYDIRILLGNNYDLNILNLVCL